MGTIRWAISAKMRSSSARNTCSTSRVCVASQGTNLGNFGGAARKDALIESEGDIVNEHGVRFITGYHKMGNSRKDAIIKREGHMVNEQGVRCITGYHIMSKRGNTAKGKVHETTSLGEHHSHICISVICQRGASIK